jgi:hypothetical protein
MVISFLIGGQPELSLGVEGISVFVGVPFVLGEAGVVVGIDDGVLGLGEWDFAEGVAEAEAAKGDWFEPSGDSDAEFYDWQLVIG